MRRLVYFLVRVQKLFHMLEYRDLLHPPLRQQLGEAAKELSSISAAQVFHMRGLTCSLKTPSLSLYKRRITDLPAH